MLPTQRVPGKGHGRGFPCRSPSSRAALGFLKAKGQPPATSPRRIPGAHALQSLTPRPPPCRFAPGGLGGRASTRARLARRAGSGDCFGSPARPRGPQRASPPCSLGPFRPSGNWQILPRPRPPGWRAGPALWGGARGPPGSAGGRQIGGAGSSAARSTLPAQSSLLLARAARGPLRQPVAAPAPRAPAPLLAPRAFQGRHLFATSSLLRQVCLGACEHSSARLSTRLQPAPPGQHASPPVKRGRRCPAARAAASPLRRY